MTQEELNTILDNDPYQQKRKEPTENEIRLFLREVNYHCPLCGKELQAKKQKKANRMFEIAHIYPNRPTIEQYQTLHLLERLGENSESFENKIALCKDCHSAQDYHTTAEDYITLKDYKKHCLTMTALHDATISLGLEDEISYVIQKLPSIQDDMTDLEYKTVAIANKFTDQESLLKAKITGYVTTYYPYIRELLRQMDGKNGFLQTVLAEQIHSCFQKMNIITTDKSSIFSQMVTWIKNKTQSQSSEACEAIISFFVQNCEVFNEITE